MNKKVKNPDRFVWKENEIEFKASCFKCKHKFNTSVGCTAFTVIPDSILSGEFDHTKKYIGQKNNILFERIDPTKVVNIANIIKLLIRDEGFLFIPREIGQKIDFSIFPDLVNKTLSDYETTMATFPIYENAVVFSHAVSGSHIFDILIPLFKKNKTFKNVFILSGVPKKMFKKKGIGYQIQYIINSKTGRAANMLLDSNISDIFFRRGSLFEYKKNKIDGKVLKIFLNEIVENSNDYLKEPDMKKVFGNF